MNVVAAGILEFNFQVTFMQTAVASKTVPHVAHRGNKLPSLGLRQALRYDWVMAFCLHSSERTHGGIILGTVRREFATREEAYHPTL